MLVFNIFKNPMTDTRKRVSLLVEHFLQINSYSHYNKQFHFVGIELVGGNQRFVLLFVI